MTKQVVLTGGAAGIGEATAARLLERGHQVVVLDLNEPPAAEGLTFVRCDLGDPDSIDEALAEVGDLQMLPSSCQASILS